MTQGQAPDTSLHATSREAPRRRWVLVLVAYWVTGAIAVAVLPWMIPVLPYLLTVSDPAFLAGSIVFGWLIFVPIATAVGLVLGVASVAVARLTRLRAAGLRRWVVYLTVLVVAYALVVVAVHFLAPAATVSVISYAMWALLLTVGSCFLIAWFERPCTTRRGHESSGEATEVIGQNPRPGEH